MDVDLTAEDKVSRNNFIGWIVMLLVSLGLVGLTKNWLSGIWLVLVFGVYGLIYLTEKVEEIKKEVE